jgi:hypothetical protein
MYTKSIRKPGWFTWFENLNGFENNMDKLNFVPEVYSP